MAQAKLTTKEYELISELSELEARKYADKLTEALKSSENPVETAREIIFQCLYDQYFSKASQQMLEPRRQVALLESFISGFFKENPKADNPAQTEIKFQ